MSKRKRKVLVTILLCILLLAVAAGGTVYYYILSPPFQISETTYIHIDRDDTVDSLYHKINTQASPNRMIGFEWLARYYKFNKVRTGRYAIYPNDNTLAVFRRLSRGVQKPLNISFNNIRTRQQLAKRLSNQLMIDSAEIADRLFDPAFQEKIGYKDETIISMFIPNTYEVYWNISVNEFFERMQKEHDRFWTEERKNKAKAIGLSPEEVSTLASIVEEETNNNAEKPTVAGLYINRLQRGIPLQADPTIKFALQDFGLQRIYNTHLTIESPYNTYTNTGLPPGPIRIPSIKGIDSVLNYGKHNYIYMCAKEDLSGTHNFASTFAEHQINARKYWNALNKRKIF